MAKTKQPANLFANDDPVQTSRTSNLAAPGDVPTVPSTVQTAPTSGEAAGSSAEANIPDSLVGKSVYVIDSLSLIFQVFHAIPEMTGPRGEPVGAVFGFARDLLTLLARKPDYLFFAFDVGSTTFRTEMYAEYKGLRAEMPVDLIPQLDSIDRVLEALGTPRLGCPNYEADDILAMIARQTDERGGECYLVTADKDCRQLIGDRVKMFNIRKNQMLDAAGLMADWGVRPDQVIDYQTLVGDSVDNIKGVPLIGPKLAREFLQKYDTLDNLYAHIDELPAGKRKQNLIEFRAQVEHTRKLVRLEPDVPLAVDWEAGRVDRLDLQRLLPVFGEFGFHGLTQQVRGAATKPAPAATWETNYRVVSDSESLAAFLDNLSQQRQVALDVVALGGSPRSAEVIGYSFSWTAGETFYLPVRAPLGEPHLDPAATLAALKPIFENPEIKKIGHDLKVDRVLLLSAGVYLQGIAFDTMVASYLLDAGERNHSLEELAQRSFQYCMRALPNAAEGKSPPRLDAVAPAVLARCIGQTVDLALRLQPVLAAGLQSAELTDLFQTLELPLIAVLADLEFQGIRVDRARLAELSEKFGQRVAALESEIYALAGKPFNIGSPKQLAEILFTDLKLPVIKKTKTGVSTDVEVLAELASQHPLPAKIIEYRQYSKLKNTYVDALPQLIQPATGRIHALFNQVVAATGRLSASDPNLQNIPIRSESGREIRSAFLPGHDGWQLLAADYSQIELRVLAHFCGDPALRQAFANDEDIHARVASQVYGVGLAEVTSAMRRVAKAVNFGVIYGQSPFGLSKALAISKDEAAQFIDAYFAGYPGIERFLTEILESCRRNGYVRTIRGRRRTIRGVRDPRETQKGAAASHQRNLSEREAINTVIQGSAADLIKLAMINVQHRLRREKLQAAMLLQIHDELIFEAPAGKLAALAELVRAEMSGVLPLDVPLKVDVKIGRNWAEVEAMSDGAIFAELSSEPN